ncbi:MAG: hypothetical protein EXR79_16545 [Myxococcales bacterium]|nr:hypothetical protein [Myxococcales bacterium]
MHSFRPRRRLIARAAVLASAAVVAVLPLTAAPAWAQSGDDPAAAAANWPMKWDVGLFLGFNGFSEKNDLGNGPDPKDSVNSSGVFGLRGAGWVTDSLGIEAEFKLVPTDLARGTGARATVYGVRAAALYQLMADKPMRPFALVGVGQDIFVAKDNDAARKAKGSFVADSDPDRAFLLGAGFKWQALHRIGVRFDVRYVAGEARCNSGAGKDCPRDAVSHNIEGMLGLAYTLGGKPEDSDGDGMLDPDDTCIDQAEDKDGFQDKDGCPEIDNDSDKVPDTEDKCPNEAEDMDGFEDYDGCPESDNDKDGVADPQDKCATQAEDKDGFQDNDGCPELDNDADKIPDTKDKCPNSAEDLDMFQDEDGCPETDNDGDGTPDAKDKCPNEAETKNGFLDDDGCRDELPAEVVALTKAPITGVAFDKKGVLDEKKSATALQAVAGALAAHESVRVTMKLSTATVEQAAAQARVDAIKSFLIKRGVESERIEALAESSLAPGAKPAKGAPADTLTIQMK